MVRMFKIGVFAIILDERRRVLLCRRRDHDLWNLPGGGLESGEAPWVGVIREVKEETNLDVQVGRLAGIYSKPDQNEVVFSFVCKICGGSPAPTAETKEIKYFNCEEIPTNTSPKQIIRIKDALDSAEVIMKVQTGPSSIELLREGKLK